MLKVEDYIHILRLRKWVVLSCLLIGMLVAGVVFVVLPKVYSSSTLIVVENQKIPENYVRGVVAGNVQERLILIQQIVLSRSLLSNIIEEFKLYRDVVDSSGLETAIEYMRTKIKISTVGRGEKVEAFSLSFMNENPLTAMKVVSKLASQFIEENLKMREQLVEGATQFLEQEVESAKANLDAKERAISEFKAKRMGELPEQLESNLRALDRAQADLTSTDDALRKFVERLGIMEKAITDLEMISKDINEYKGLGSDTPKTSGSALGNSLNARLVGDPLVVRLRQLEQTLATLSGEYKDTYPDVIQVRQEIQKIKAQLIEKQNEMMAQGEAQAANQQPVEENRLPQRISRNDPSSETYLLGLITQREEVKAEIASLKSKKRALVERIKLYERRVDRIPTTQQEILAILRDAENMQRNYQSLLDKKLNARVAENLEKRQKGEQFRVVDPANLPTKPASPNPWIVFLGGVVGGLGLAGASTWWLDFRNLPFRRPEEIESALELPTLATIPHMSSLHWPEENPKSLEAPKRPQWVQWLEGPKKAARRILAAIPWKRKAVSEKRTPAVIQANRNALGAEQFRVLAGRIIQLRDKKGACVMAVTSSVAGEGKTTLSMGLAVTLARDFLEETVLIDGDMRNPSIGARLGIEEEKGLMNVISGECELDKALYQHEQPTLKILPAGTSNVDRIGLPATRLFIPKILDNLRHRGVIVILDGPPILPMADMNLYSEIVDGIVLVVKAVQTPQQVVVEALDFLTGGNVEGAVLNGVVDLNREYYKGYSQSRYTIVETPPIFSLSDSSRADRAFGQSSDKSHNGN
jgi:polysaccharide chain length determinant protein (PEP-CTERM system associated)